MDQLLDRLKAVAEPTRLRIIVALESCELTVSEICTVLGQTQPRVSRHLKLLTDAGLLQRHAEGTSAYFGLRTQAPNNDLLTALAPLIDRSTPVLQRDQVRLREVREERARRAGEYFADVADQWDQLRELYAPTTEVEAAMLAAIKAEKIDTLLDIGTGTGRVLELFADRVKRGLGIDSSRQMLNVARSRLDEDELRHCSVRHRDIYDLDVEDESQQVVILHHVLHFLSDPLGALAAVERTLAVGGTLLIVDFAEHGVEELRTEHAHSHLGFTEAQITSWSESLGLVTSTPQHILPPDESAADALTVTLWTATKPEQNKQNSNDSEMEVTS